MSGERGASGQVEGIRMIDVYTWDDITELREGQPKPSSEPIKTKNLAWIDGVLCQLVVMNGGAGASYWVRLPVFRSK